MFRGKMNGIKDVDQPDWYAINIKPILANKFSKSLYAANLSKGQTSIKHLTVLGFSHYKKDTFQLHMAMHYCDTDMSFQINTWWRKSRCCVLTIIFCLNARS